MFIWYDKYIRYTDNGVNEGAYRVQDTANYTYLIDSESYHEGCSACKQGNYVCRRCNQPLFSSKSKFDAGCGWPAFDESFPNAIKRIADPDGTRTEIECAKCGAHLGHEFVGERLTAKNTRECVNSLSIRFVPTSLHE